MKNIYHHSWIVILLAMGIYNAFNPTTFEKNMCNLIGVLLIIFAILMKHWWVFMNEKNCKRVQHTVNILLGIVIFLIGYDSELMLITTICSSIIILLSLIMLFSKLK